jgi:hypothetical protein
LENCVPTDQFNKRFSEIDSKILFFLFKKKKISFFYPELLYKQQNYSAPPPILIPYYLCIKTIMHIHDIPSLRARKSSEKDDNNAFGEKHLEHEYWFSVPKDKFDIIIIYFNFQIFIMFRIDHLYSFFLLWTPENGLDPLITEKENQLKSNHDNSNKGFVLLATDDPELADNYLIMKNQRKTKNEQQKEAHYLTKQNTLLKEWEVRSNIQIYCFVI